MRHPLFAFTVAAYVVWGGYSWYTNRPVRQLDGVLAADDPVQRNLASSEAILHGRWRLTPRADYSITARILARERYHFDALSDLVPEDLALGWGPMSDNRVLKTLEISQSHRFYFWRAPPNSPLGKEQIIVHSANTHVIPANSKVAAALLRLRPGEVVTLSGELVDGVRDDGMRVKTSLVRDDTGAGACEIMLVDEVQS